MELFSLRKRINRKTYFVGYVFYMVLVVGYLVMVGVSTDGRPIDEVKLSSAVLALQTMYLVAIAAVALILDKQRANDISGEKALWYFLLSALLIGFFIGFFKGEDKENKYGPVPQSGVNFG